MANVKSLALSVTIKLTLTGISVKKRAFGRFFLPVFAFEEIPR